MKLAKAAPPMGRPGRISGRAVILFDILNEEKFLLPNLGRIRLASPLFIVSTPSRLLSSKTKGGFKTSLLLPSSLLPRFQTCSLALFQASPAPPPNPGAWLYTWEERVQTSKKNVF